jgi:hypothetical protein
VALSKDKALTLAQEIWAGPRMHEQPRLNFLAHSVTPPRSYNVWLDQPSGRSVFGGPTVEMPEDATQVMKNLAAKSRTNFLPLVLDTFSQVMKADGYVEANGTPSKAWEHWQRNGLDARQTGIHRSALHFGAAYAPILPGDTGPLIEGVSARRMTAIYQDPSVDDWPMAAIDVNGPMITLYDETSVYRIGIENYPISGLGAALLINPGEQFVFIDSWSHGMGFCPVARFRDRMLLGGEEQLGIIEPLIDIQRRIDETNYGHLMSQYFTAFKQRYIIGWVPASEQEALKTEAGSFWAFDDENVKVGEFSDANLDNYIQSKNSALGDMAAIAQVPSTALGASPSSARNVSPEAVASIDAGKDRKSGEIKTSFGETWELVLRTASAIAGDSAAAADTSSQLRWKDMTTTSSGAIVDALGKMNQMLGIPVEMLWERIPGWTDQDQDRATALIEAGDKLDKMIFTLGKLQQAPGDGVDPALQQPQDPQLAAGPMGNGG